MKDSTKEPETFAPEIVGVIAGVWKGSVEQLAGELAEHPVDWNEVLNSLE